MVDPATRRRGGDADVKSKPKTEKSDDKLERRLEEGLEETMAGSDPLSVTQPTPNNDPVKKTSREE
jgi:hypothetical protein